MVIIFVVSVFGVVGVSLRVCMCVLSVVSCFCRGICGLIVCLLRWLRWCGVCICCCWFCKVCVLCIVSYWLFFVGMSCVFCVWFVSG